MRKIDQQELLAKTIKEACIEEKLNVKIRVSLSVMLAKKTNMTVNRSYATMRS